LNRNGHYLDIDRRYKGDAVEAHNLATRGKMALVQHGAGAVGGGAGTLVGGHVGAAGGAFIGEKLGHKWAAGIERAADKKAWQKRVRQL
jgi:phage tail tape-measure protein